MFFGLLLYLLFSRVNLVSTDQRGVVVGQGQEVKYLLLRMDLGTCDEEVDCGG